jgi:hypothetical protein
VKRPMSSIENLLARKEAATAEPVKAKARRNQSKKGVACTFVMSRESYLKFQEIRLARSTTLQGLFEEMADTWLASIGETGFKRIEE